MEYENNERKSESIFSKRIRAGKRRTYFFDIKSTRGNDYYLTITESRKRFNDDGYDRHKIFIYKEDFNKFIKALSETVDHVKTELMPDFDFDAFNHEYPESAEGGFVEASPASAADDNSQVKTDSAYQKDTAITNQSEQITNNTEAITNQTEEVDKW